ncbi:hypothetical protein [Streptomyces sp. NPDC054794]
MGELTVEERAQQHKDGCNKRAREHQLSYERYRRRAALLNGIAAVSGALAGGTLLSGAEGGTVWAYVAGSLAAIGAIAASLEVRLGYTAQTQAHGRAASRFATFRTAFYDLADVEAPDQDKVRLKLDELTQRKAELEEVAPLVEEWARKKREQEAKRRREEGK